MTEKKLTCREVARILSDGLDTEMAPAERARLRLHMVVCEACRNLEQQLEVLRRLMKHQDPGGPDDPAR
jgi:predicted anti-sigma-YlaC factor YlaD